MCEYDETQSIGRRYRRQDEIGTPYCVTVDFESLEDQQVTVRERDSTEQTRLPIDDSFTIFLGGSIFDAAPVLRGGARFADTPMSRLGSD